MREVKTTGMTWMTLLFSLATLICCVLPLVLVSLGFGFAVIALTTHFPVLITLSKHKIWIFLISGILLLTTAWLLWRSSRSCPTDPKLAALCERVQKWNKRIFWTAAAIWLLSFVVTYIIGPLLLWVEG